MDDNFNQQNWNGVNNNQGQGRAVPPPPPPPEITLRTMQSDIESVKQSGGENPVPKPFTPPEVKKQPTMELDDLSKEDGMIKPGSGDGVVPPPGPKKSGMKAAILIIVLILVLGAAAYVGYVYVYPIFAKPAISLNTPPVTTQTTSNVPSENSVIPEVISTTTPESASTTVGQVVLPESTTTATETATTTAIAPVPPVILPHASLLVSQPEMTSQIALNASSTLSFIKSALITEAANKPQTVTAVKEIVFSNENGQPSFADIFSMFLPDFSAASLNSIFAQDFTTVMTYDKDGVWLGFVAKLNPGVDPSVAKTTMQGLEKSVNLANLYLQNPGKSAAAFKAGSANNLPMKYLSFANTGASLNYGWTANNLFVMSDSYNGMKALLTKLGIQ